MAAAAAIFMFACQAITFALHMPLQKRHTLAEAIVKIRSFCNYRERCHLEVREKLYTLGLYRREVDDALAQMIDEGLLNEERYARSFARGYFRNRQWGRFKIMMALRERKIHERLIEKALEEIDPSEYEQVISQLIAKKNAALPNMKAVDKKRKISSFLLGRGFRYAEFKAHLDQAFPSN
jgi:regulatory protein